MNEGVAPEFVGPKNSPESREFPNIRPRRCPSEFARPCQHARAPIAPAVRSVAAKENARLVGTEYRRVRLSPINKGDVTYGLGAVAVLMCLGVLFTGTT
jgi:hypothetical protein